MNAARRVLLLGGTSEIGLAIVRALALPPGSAVVLAGRDEALLRAAADTLPTHVRTSFRQCDANRPETVRAAVTATFEDGPVDLVIPAFGVLGDQSELDEHPATAEALLTVNVVAQISALLETARHLRRQGHGTIVVLSSVAAVRPRRANYVYGASKAALDAFARGLADAHATGGVRVVLVRPGFVVGRMTAGRRPLPFATTPAAVGEATARAIRADRAVVWVPPVLRVLAVMLRLAPRPLWRRLRR